MPLQVIHGRKDEPYAVRTPLGWGIVGPSSPEYDSSVNARVGNKVTVRELPPVTPADAIKVLESDFKDSSTDSKIVSQENLLFLDLLKEGIQKNEHTRCHSHLKKDLTCQTTNNKLSSALSI